VAARQCTVSFIDASGINHSVKVSAESLYEAVALAVRIFRQHDCAPGSASRIEVEVLSPSVKHTLTLSKLHEWLNGGGNSPNQILLKKRLRALVESKA
jgi:hypothetical protein